MHPSIWAVFIDLTSLTFTVIIKYSSSVLFIEAFNHTIFLIIVFKYLSQRIFLPSQKVIRFEVLTAALLKNHVFQGMVLYH